MWEKKIQMLPWTIRVFFMINFTNCCSFKNKNERKYKQISIVRDLRNS